MYSAVAESCGGWRLNKLPEVKAFITGDLVNKFQRTEYKKIAGKSPELVFLNEGGEELERLNIEKFTGAELHQLLVDRGIPQKIVRDEM